MLAAGVTVMVATQLLEVSLVHIIGGDYDIYLRCFLWLFRFLLISIIYRLRVVDLHQGLVICTR
jgi:hypothetical protein